MRPSLGVYLRLARRLWPHAHQQGHQPQRWAEAAGAGGPALAGSPEILILDDSSSALDYKTDAALRKALREEYQGITTIIIAQRVSSILHADHILVLEEGKELGYGTHQELLRSCPVYQDIAHSQMGYSQDGALEAREKEVV